MSSRPARTIVLAMLLFALWLLMSGVYKPLLISLGVVSSVGCALICARLGLLDRAAPHEILRVWESIKYIFWLTVEIGKADWAVTRVILSPDLPRRQHLIDVGSDQKSDLAKMLFANSITITPGTITVETEGDHFLVHALTDEAADLAGLAAMGERVSALEKSVAGA